MFWGPDRLPSGGRRSSRTKVAVGTGLSSRRCEFFVMRCWSMLCLVLLAFLALLADPVQAGPLHDAAASGNLAKVRDLLDNQGVSVDQKGYLGETALHQAASRGRLEVVDELLVRQAAVDPRDRSGRTPLDWASTNGQLETMVRLLDAGANPNARSQGGYAIVHAVAEIGDLGEARRSEVLRLLVTRGADIHARVRGAGMLHLLARGAHLEGMRAVVDLGVPVDDLTPEGLTPLHTAAAAGQSRPVLLLLEMGAQVDRASPDGSTALIKAAAQGNPVVVEALLKAGASPTRRNQKGQTALEIARSRGHQAAARLLHP